MIFSKFGLRPLASVILIIFFLASSSGNAEPQNDTEIDDHLKKYKL